MFNEQKNQTLIGVSKELLDKIGRKLHTLNWTDRPCMAYFTKMCVYNLCMCPFRTIIILTSESGTWRLRRLYLMNIVLSVVWKIWINIGIREDDTGFDNKSENLAAF